MAFRIFRLCIRSSIGRFGKGLTVATANWLDYCLGFVITYQEVDLLRPHNLLVVAVLFLPACSSETATETETRTADPAATERTPESLVFSEGKSIVKAKLTKAEMAAKAESERLAAEERAKLAAELEAARIVKVSNERFASLQKELDESTRAWTNAMQSVRTRAEAKKLRAENPGIEIAAKLVALAEEFPESDAAHSAWQLAAQSGSGPGKTKACNKLLELAEADAESETAFETFTMLLKSGTDNTRTTAMGHLLGKVEKDLESEESFALLKDMALVGGSVEPKQKAIEHLLAIAEADFTSAKSGECYELLTRTDNAEAKDTAIDKMIEHHIDHEKMSDVVGRIVGQMPSAKAESRLKFVCENGEGKVHATALVTLVDYIGRRDLYRGFYRDADEETAKSLGEETMAYMRAESDPKEMDQLEVLLEKFVEGHEPLLDSAKKQLFTVQNLSVGRVAPDIVANDLNGVEFKLSDYRGKVVFLDFWGDW